MTRPRIGLALGSGAARGWSHIAIIEALSEAGIEPEIVCGTSMGALVGAAYVAGRLADLRRWAEAASWREIVPLIDVRLMGGGLIDAKKVIEFLREMGVGGPIEGYPKAYAAVATDFLTGRETWLQSGPILEAVRASIALPGLISPARVDGRWLLDGGLVNPVPVSVCRALGADVIIAVNLNGDLVGRRFESAPDASMASPFPAVPSEFFGRMLSQLPPATREQATQIALRLLPQGPFTPGYFDVLTNSINIMQDHITRTRLAGEPPHVMLMPRVQNIGMLEFARAQEAFAEGRACVEAALPMLQRYI
ncbi:MAG TPA: patatin-like phospholipase family protein [Methylocystis sp.]|nr:patatin-like phospholipase family protein [Methylocystis sp.]